MAKRGYRFRKEIVIEMARNLSDIFSRIHNPPRFYDRPYLTRKEIVRSYEVFMKHRGRSEWEIEAVTKAIAGCSCPVWMIYSSVFEEANKEAGQRITCEKCRIYFE